MVHGEKALTNVLEHNVHKTVQLNHEGFWKADSAIVTKCLNLCRIQIHKYIHQHLECEPILWFFWLDFGERVRSSIRFFKSLVNTVDLFWKHSQVTAKKNWTFKHRWQFRKCTCLPLSPCSHEKINIYFSSVHSRSGLEYVKPGLTKTGGRWNCLPSSIKWKNTLKTTLKKPDLHTRYGVLSGQALGLLTLIDTGL